jgi:hypothetical protein
MENVAEAEEQIRAELERMQPMIEEITGLRSHWNGSVELVADTGFRGKKALRKCSRLRKKPIRSIPTSRR